MSATVNKRGKIGRISRQISGARADCTLNARDAPGAHEISPVIGRVIEQLKQCRCGLKLAAPNRDFDHVLPIRDSS
jgi:hypothetical protein